MYACDPHYTCNHNHTPSVEYTCRGNRPTWAAPCCIVHLQFVHVHVHTVSHFLSTRTEPFTNNTDSESSCAMPRTRHQAVRAPETHFTCFCLFNESKITRLLSCVDTWCYEAFVVKHSMIVRIRTQQSKFSCEYEHTFGIISFTQLNLSMVPGHF